MRHRHLLRACQTRWRRFGILPTAFRRGRISAIIGHSRRSRQSIWALLLREYSVLFLRNRGWRRSSKFRGGCLGCRSQRPYGRSRIQKS